MATLSTALNYALAGLSVSATQSSVVSRNVSSAGDENYTRKSADIVSLPNVGPVVAQISRSSDRLLLDKLMTSTSDASSKQIVLDALSRMSSLTGDPEADQSIAASLSRLQDALRNYEQNPSSGILAQSAVEAARNVAQKTNTASSEVDAVRSDADSGMADSAERIRNLLAQFKIANDSVVRGQGTAGDLSETLDQRDAIIKLLSDEIGIRTTVRPNNDVQIYAEGGAVLFEGSPRTVGFEKSDLLTSGVPGNALTIDGVPVTGANAPMPVSGGKTDPQIPAGLPVVEGLFRGTGAVPSQNGLNSGLAGKLRINEMADPDQGGSPSLLRDGGFGGPGYVRNIAGQSGFQARIAELVDALDTKRDFDNQSGLGGSASLKEFSTKSASWVETRRQAARASLDAATATKSRATTSLAQVSGVNIDQEMATLLDLEKSYQASSKVMSVVNSMLTTLLEVVGR